MTKQDYLNNVLLCSINEKRVKALSELYGKCIDGIIAQIVSYADNADFIGEDRRALSFSEILNASKDYEKDFISLGIIPFIDAYDNDLIVYVITENMWAKYSLSDEVLFKKKDSIEKLL